MISFQKIAYSVVFVATLASSSVSCMNIFQAVKEGRVDIIQDILAAIPADQRFAFLIRKDNSGYAPLHVATGFNRVNIIQALIAALPEGRRTDFLSQHADNGFTALHLAAFYGRVPLVQVLIEAGAPLDITDRSNRTPAQVAILQDHPNIAVLIDDYRERIAQTRAQVEF